MVGFMGLVNSVIQSLWLTNSISYFGYSALTSRASEKNISHVFAKHFFVYMYMHLDEIARFLQVVWGNKMKTDSCNSWSDSTVDDFFGSTKCEIIFRYYW
jgi:hypothetical protein